MRSRPKLDTNHAEIVSFLRHIGCSVQSLASIGGGVPDILVACSGRMWVAEIKDGNKPPSQRRLTPDEQEWHERWKSRVYILHNIDEALDMINQR